jgi:hypothetical protein
VHRCEIGRRTSESTTRTFVRGALIVALFPFRTNGKRHNTKSSRKPLITVPPPWSSYDPVFEAMDRVENDYHRFARRIADQRRYNEIR